MQRPIIHGDIDRKRLCAVQEAQELLEVLRGDYSNLSQLARFYVRLTLTEVAEVKNASRR